MDDRRYIAEITPKEIQTEEDIIREVAEEEGMAYSEVKEIWDTFKLLNSSSKKKRDTKTKFDKSKTRNKNRQAKKSRKKNR